MLKDVLLVVALGLAALVTTSGRPDDERQQPSRRVVLLSIDGGADWIVDRLLDEGKAPAFAGLARDGAAAEAMISTLPTLTAVAHTTLWTGASPRVHGVTGNWMPRLPADEHTLLERRSGYLNEGILAEPIWITAARAGKQVLVVQGSGGYPFSGEFPERLTQFDIYANERLPLEVVTGTLQDGRGELRVGDSRLALTATAGGLAVRAGGRVVTLSPTGPFSPALDMEVGGRPGTFRLGLLELDAASGRYVLVRGAVADLVSTDARARDALQATAGTIVGEDVTAAYRRGRLGPTLARGGHGVAERRLGRTLAAHQEYFDGALRYAASREWELLVLYVPSLDVAGHALGGMLDPDSPRYREERAAAAWHVLEEIFARCADQYVAAIRSAWPDAALVVVSDHGVEGVGPTIFPNVVLREAGLLAVDPDGRPDLARTRAMYLYSAGGGVFVNSTRFKGGIVSAGEVPAVKQAAAAALLGAIDPATDRPFYRAVIDTALDGEGLGIGGPLAPDLYPDPAPGYAELPDAAAPRVTGDGIPEGAGLHGPQPWRRKLHAIFYAAGPGIRRGARLGVVQAVDVAPTVAALLGVPAPPQSVGKALPVSED